MWDARWPMDSILGRDMKKVENPCPKWYYATISRHRNSLINARGISKKSS